MVSTIKTKILYSNFNRETGISTVIIKNKYGKFKGWSRLHIEDEQYASNYAGCRFAEFKAEIKCLKKQRADLKLRLKELNYFKKMLEDTNGYNVDSIEARKLRKRIHIVSKEIHTFDEKIESATNALQQEIKARDKALSFLKKYRNNEMDSKND